MTGRRHTLPGLGREATATEAEAFWRALSEEVERRVKPARAALAELQDVANDLRDRVARLEAREAPSTPPAGTVELQGPRGLRLRGAAWAVVLLGLLALLGIVAWWWGPPAHVPSPQTHSGK